MNPFIYQNDGVQCNCFHNSSPINHAGLKPSRNNSNYFNATNFHRATKSTESKIQKQQNSRIKTSLRREKPKTPNQSRTHMNSERPTIEQKFDNQRLSINEERVNAMPKWSNLKPPTHFINLSSPQYQPPTPQNFQLQQKRVNLVRNQPIKQNNQPFKIDFNLIQQPKLQEPNLIKKTIIINYENPPCNTSRSPPPPIVFTERIQRKTMIPNPTVQSITNLKSSRESKRCSLRGSDKKDKHTTPRAQPFKMMLKQIESVVDENQLYEEQVSEVIGRGWQHNHDQSFTDFHKGQKLITETHATGASNIKNSSSNFSIFGPSQSQLKR